MLNSKIHIPHFDKIYSVIAVITVITLAYLLGMFILTHPPMLVIQLAVGGTFFVLFLFKPEIGLLGFVSIASLLDYTVGTEGLSSSFPATSLVKVAGLALLLGWLMNVIILKKLKEFVRAPQNIVILLFFFGAVVSVYFSVKPIISLMKLQTYLMLVLLYFISANLTLNSPTLVKRFAWIFIICGAITAILAISQIASGSLVRAVGARSNANGLAASCVITLPFIFGLYFTSKRTITKIILYVLTGILVFAIIASGSRTGLITLGFVIVVSILALAKLEKIRILGLIIVGGIILILIEQQVSIPIVAKNRILKIPSPIAFFTQSEKIKGSSARNRSLHWYAGQNLFMEKPIFGHGLDMHKEVAYRYGVGHGRAAHSLYVQLATEQGLVGIILYFILIYLTFRDFRKARHIFEANSSDIAYYTTAFALSFLAFLFFSFATNSLYGKYQYIVIGLAPALRAGALSDSR